MRRGQSFVEYALLVAVALVGLLVVANSLLKDSAKNGFAEHFRVTKKHITGN